MKTTFLTLVSVLSATFRSRLALQMEILALRHQLSVCRRSGKRPGIRPIDRILWVLLSKVWPRWRDVLVFVQPSTIIAWQRKRFRDHWRRLSQGSEPGRPRVARETRELIRRMSIANPTWGSPRIVGELGMLGISVAKSAVDKYMARPRKPPSPTWRSFLKNHVRDLVSIDFFVVPTVRFKVLFVLIVLLHHRRRVVHFNVTEHPTAQWTAQQVAEAFPWDHTPKYLLRDRDRIYGEAFRTRVGNMGMQEVLIAPRSPWQNPFAERVIGSIRRECLDHVIVLNERHLKGILKDYFRYYHRWRTHLSLDMDCPEPRVVQYPESGSIVAFPEVSGLHHHYERVAA